MKQLDFKIFRIAIKPSRFQCNMAINSQLTLDLSILYFNLRSFPDLIKIMSKKKKKKRKKSERRKGCNDNNTVKTLNIGTPRPATVVVLNIKQFNFTMKQCLQKM